MEYTCGTGSFGEKTISRSLLLSLRKMSTNKEVVQIEKRILVVNEDVAFCQAFQARMQSNCIAVSCVQSELKALDIFIRQEWCLVILDIQSSDKNWMEMLRIMRSTKQTPILTLIPPLEKEEKIALFHAGADVCLDKATDIEISVAQAEALIRVYFSADFDHNSHKSIIHSEEFILIPCYRQVIIDGKLLELTRREFDLLHCIAKIPGLVFTREQLYDYVWNYGASVAVDETVKAQIKSLRKKLASVGKYYIQNEWGVGYKFVLSKIEF